MKMAISGNARFSILAFLTISTTIYGMDNKPSVEIPSPINQATVTKAPSQTISESPISDGTETIQTKTFNTRIKLVIVVIAICMIVITSVITIIVSRNRISSWDIVAANNSASDLGTDVTSINTQIYSVQLASSLPDFQKISTSISASITDAQRQYGLLNSSTVLKNEQVLEKFKPVQQKWSAYVTYVTGVSNDYKELGPLLIQLNSAQQSALSTSKMSNANLGAELVGYKSLLDAISQQITSLTMQTTPDKQLLTALNTYITSTDRNVALTQTDISQGNNVNKVSTDITQIAFAASTFSDNETTWGTESYNNLQKLDPASAIKAYESMLTSISKSQG